MTGALGGILAPVVTTFGAGGELDVGAFVANLESHMAAELDGVVVAGSTGEAALLDESERGSLVDAAREVVPRNKLLIVGTGAESTRTCIRLCGAAAARGADAVLVVAPHYYGAAMTQAALRAHYERVADACRIPVVLYNIPKYMHFALSGELVAALARHGNIIGIKDSSGDRDLLAAYLAAQSDRFGVLTGSGALISHAAASRARGGIVAVSLFAPALSLAVYEAAQRGSPDADDLQARLAPLAATIVGELGVAGVKAAMDLVGLRGGPVRSPLQPLGPEQLARVGELLRSAELSLAA